MARQRLTTAWAVCMDVDGQVTLLDEKGEHPLEDPDPIQRIAHFRLVAAAPLMREMLREAADLADRLIGDGVAYQWRKDATRVMGWRAVLLMSYPLMSELERAQRVKQAQENAAAWDAAVKERSSNTAA